MTSIINPVKGKKYLTKIENGKVYFKELLTHYNLVEGYIFNVIDIKDMGNQILAITSHSEWYMLEKVPENTIVCLP